MPLISRIHVLILIISISYSAIGEENQLGNTVLKSQFDSLRYENIQLKNNIRVIRSNLSSQDSVLRILSYETKKIKFEKGLYEKAIEIDDKIFNGLSTYFTLISILLSVIVIAIPVVNYFLVLKPNKESQKKLESLEHKVIKKIEDNFETYFEVLKKKRNKLMISKLEDRSKLTEVSNHFLIEDSETLEEDDISKVIKFLEVNNDIEVFDKLILNSVVIDSKFLIAEKFYKSIFEKNDKENYEYAIKYLVKNNFETHINYITQLIKASEDGHNLLIDFFEYISKNYSSEDKSSDKVEKGIKFINLLLNNDDILDGIKNKPIPKGILFEEHRIDINVIYDNPYLRKTKYYKIYLEKIDDLSD